MYKKIRAAGNGHEIGLQKGKKTWFPKAGVERSEQGAIVKKLRVN